MAAAAAAADKVLEGQLLECGKKLLKPPSTVDQLLNLLDKLEAYLSKVEQSPSQSMHNSLAPSMKALVANELLRHPDADVKVSVASCISEITRITAPEAPYEDDQMKEIFQLIVGSFEKLYDTSSRSYVRRASILETVAKVRSCVVMLDLECDGLIIEMFQHFLKAIRTNQLAIFSSMETIMVLVLEESEEISTELLCPLLSSVKKENKDVLPIAKKLAEEVLEKCAAKVKPYLMQAVVSLGTPVHEYSKVVGAICLGTGANIENDDVRASEEHLDDQEKTKARVDSHAATQVVDERKPDVAEEQKSVVSEDKKSEVSEEQKPEVAEDKKSEVSEEQNLEVAEQQKPEVAEEEKPPEVTAEEKEEVAEVEKREVAEEEKPQEKLEVPEEEKPQEKPEVPEEEKREVAVEEKQGVAEEHKPVVASTGAVESVAKISEKLVTSNGTSGKTDAQISSDGLQKEEISSSTTRHTEDELNINSSKAADSETTLDRIDKEPEDQKLNTSQTSSDKQDGEHEDKKTSHSAEANSSPLKECSLGETAVPSEKETANAASPSHSLHEETQSKKGARRHKKSNSTRDSEPDSSSAQQDQAEDQAPPAAAEDIVSDKENKGDKGSKEKLQADSEDEAPPSAEVISQNESKAKKSSGAKQSSRSRRKARASDVRSSRLMDDILATKSGPESDSEAKPVGVSKKVDDKSSKEDELTDIKEEDASKEDEIPRGKNSRTKKGRGKVNSKEVTGEPSSTKKDLTEVDNSKEDETPHDDKDIRTKKGRGKVNSKEVTEDPSNQVSSPEPTDSSDKEENHPVATPGTQSKRKRAPGEGVTPKTPKAGGKELVGEKIKVWWPKDLKYYQGTIEAYNFKTKKHKVVYLDGEIERLNLRRQKWETVEEFVPEEEDEEVAEEEVAEPSSPDSSDSEMHQKKKGKKEMETKINTSSKRRESTSVKKSDGAATKSDLAGKSSNKSKDGSLNSKGSKSKDERSTKGKEEKDGKSKDTTSKAKSKLKETPKAQGDKVKVSSKDDDATPSRSDNKAKGASGTSAAKKRKSDSSSQEISPAKKVKAEESEKKSGGKNNTQKSGSKSGRKRPRK